MVTDPDASDAVGLGIGEGPSDLRGCWLVVGRPGGGGDLILRTCDGVGDLRLRGWEGGGEVILRARGGGDVVYEGAPRIVELALEELLEFGGEDRLETEGVGV